MVEDWVLIEAAKRTWWGKGNYPIERLRAEYSVADSSFSALCDMIAKYEQRPVDPDVRLVADIVNAFEDQSWPEKDLAVAERYSEHLARAVAVYKASKA